jgi:hypothetical protein
MRKKFLGFAIAAVVVAVGLVGGRAAKADNGATHYVGTSGCGLYSSIPTCVVTPYRSVSNHGGVEVEKAWADGVFNDTGKAVHWDTTNTFGSLCQSDATGRLTSDWHETLSASGHAEITCQFKN